MVKGRRYRYIFFRVSPSISDQELEQVVKLMRFDARNEQSVVFPQRIRLMQKDGLWGIVRCAHCDKPYVLSKLNSEVFVVREKKVRMETIASSGTIRSLRTRYSLPKKEKSECG